MARTSCQGEHHEDLCHDMMAASSANWKGINNKKFYKGAAPSRGEKKPTLPFPLFTEPSKAESCLHGSSSRSSSQPELSHESAVDVRSFLRKYLLGSAKADNSVTLNHTAT